MIDLAGIAMASRTVRETTAYPVGRNAFLNDSGRRATIERSRNATPAAKTNSAQTYRRGISSITDKSAGMTMIGTTFDTRITAGKRLPATTRHSASGA